MRRRPLFLYRKMLEWKSPLNPLRLLATLAALSFALHPLVRELHLAFSSEESCQCGTCCKAHADSPKHGALNLPVAVDGASGSKHHDPAQCPACKLIGHLSEMQALAAPDSVCLPAYDGTTPVIKPCLPSVPPFFFPLPPPRAPPV